MQYTAIFGGTFNPFHIGHYEILSALCGSSPVKKVLLTPDRIPPHKECEFMAADSERIKMCEIVCNEFEKAELCLLEFERDGKSYTVDTVKELKNRNPYENYAVVCGGDMLSTLNTWHNYKELFTLCTFIAFKRAGDKSFLENVEKMRSLGAEILVFDNTITEISSTELRSRIARKMLPEKIFKYIMDEGVYLNKNIPDYSEYKKLLKSRLSEKRYFHSLCVADEAYRLAVKYGADCNKAYLAGLLHDVTKNSPEIEHLNIFETFGIILSDIEKGAKKLWHAISGSAYIKFILNIADDEIYNAIRYHTTAKSDISLLSKVIYLADFTSADRDFEDVEVIRALVDRSLDEAYLYALSFTINELVEKGSAIHPDTFGAYNQAVLNMRSDNFGK